MFTGIITAQGRVASIIDDGDRIVTLECPYVPDSYAIGDSIACDGVCLTVVAKEATPGGSVFTVTVSQETLDRTTLASWEACRVVNLEQALKLGDALGGHLVSGHVDGVATLERVDDAGDSRRMTLSAPTALAYLIAEKGSVTLDGVSLTVNGVTENHFTVNIIPHTLAATTLGKRKTGDRLNIEIDMFARYVARLMEKP